MVVGTGPATDLLHCGYGYRSLALVQVYRATTESIVRTVPLYLPARRPHARAFALLGQKSLLLLVLTM
jgi:hypothetical protein